jgi:hypothetical protein
MNIPRTLTFVANDQRPANPGSEVGEGDTSAVKLLPDGTLLITRITPAVRRLAKVASRIRAQMRDKEETP